MAESFVVGVCSGPLGFCGQIHDQLPESKPRLHCQRPDQYTALHRAVVIGNLDTYEPFRLLHARTQNGWTALHLAVCVNNFDMVDLLMECYEGIINLPPDGAWDFRDDTWMTPLQYSVVGGYPEIVGRLLKSIFFNNHVNTVDYFRRSALHMVCGHGHHVLVAKLLDKEFEFVDLSLMGAYIHCSALGRSRAGNGSREIIYGEGEREDD